MLNIDKNFLLELDHYPNKMIFTRVTILNLSDQPLQSIEGFVTQGSVTIDGNSAIRRTCSLTLVVDYNNFSQNEAQNFFDYEWSLHTKFKLEVGIQNKINNNYPEIVWFPQGVYVTTSINITYNTNNFQITLQGKDKMCLLNGEISGSLEAEIDFGQLENDQGEKYNIPIKEIILNAIHIYANEPYHNIIIKDLDEDSFQLLEYRGSSPLYLLRNNKNSSDEYINMTYQGDTPCTITNKNKKYTYTLETLEEYDKGQYDIVGETLINENLNPTEVDVNGNSCTIVKIVSGNNVGYKITDLIYPGELILGAGESLTTLLDKIISILGPYEYFYDLNGQFIFQRKQLAFKEYWTAETHKMSQFNDFTITSNNEIAYEFSNNELVTSITNTPDISNVKNDFVVRGEKTNINGIKELIYARYALDKKPLQYISIAVEDDDEELINYNNKHKNKVRGQYSIAYNANELYEVNGDDNQKQITTVNCDWREIIYQMASDYYQYGHLSDFLARVAAANPLLYPTGVTGYEQYYLDIMSNWRTIYTPLESFWIEKSQIEYFKGKTQNDLKEKEYEAQLSNIDTELKEYISAKNYFYSNGKESNHNFSSLFNGWNISVIYSPELLKFWFDFLDLDNNAELYKHSVQLIGSRKKVLTDQNLHAIFYFETPSIVYLEDIRDKQMYQQLNNRYSYLQMPRQNEIFSQSTKNLSIKDKINLLINEHSTYTENISLTTIPIYYLEPNSRIRINNKATNTQGEYYINKITIPLQHDGKMQINATKAVNVIM